MSQTSEDWPGRIFAALRRAGVSQVGYVPDAGHARLIALCHAEPAMRAIVLTTEEEGVALAAGAWLGGAKAALLMQSSGIGNCINMLTLARNCRFPLLTLVTMRGEWAEFNPWQVPMGQTAEAALRLADVAVYRADEASDVEPTVEAALDLAFGAECAVAVILGQRLIGRKRW
ncbi:MAG TPA: thiamine pyrophosphate-binding protein [Stellaceae bacterium]|nr:thiamine pyrophosphate-binding protein [Stellaceae bacterium]